MRQQIAAIVAMLAALCGGEAGAQQGAGGEIILTSQDAPWAYTKLAPVSVVVHQTSLMPKVPTEQRVDEALRAEAAKLGADAVILIRRTPGSPFHQKGFRAEGVAVKFTPAPAALSASASVAAPPATVQGPQAATPGAPNALAAAVSPDVGASAPRGAPPSRFAPPGAPATPAGIILTEQDFPNRPYIKLGEVSAFARQTSLFMKVSVRERLDEQLRAEAAKLGANAIVQVKYTTSSPLTQKGNSATGIAVKFQ